MKFGYFTLSDNAYPGTTRTANQLIGEIREQAILADSLGMHSAWIGEHHFDSLGVNSRPGTLLASIVPVTTTIRLAPAVSVLPLHHPIHLAEEWATLDLLSGGRVDFAAGRGYDRREYDPFGAPYMDSAEIFEETIDVIRKAWGEGPWSHKGRFYDIPEMEITPRPVQSPIPFYVASFSATSLDIAAARGLNVIFAPFAAAMMFGGLDAAVATYSDKCRAKGHEPGRAMCSYFIHIADDERSEAQGREAQMDYFRHCVLPAFPDHPDKAPPTMRYFMDIVRILKEMKAADLGERSILIGPPGRIIESLKRVEAVGIAEVILYFNVGNKPDAMVREQMHRFVEEIAPAFAE